MIDFFSSWAEQIIIAIVISSIIEMILPDNNNKKYVKMIIGIYVLFTIIAPIINKKDLFSLENLNIERYAVTDINTKIAETEVVNQKSMDERLQQLYVEELENNIKAKVNLEGYNVISCKVDAILYGDEKNQEIKEIDLEVDKQMKNDKANYSNERTINAVHKESDIKSVNRVEINVGFNRILGDKNKTENDEQHNTNDANIQKLRKTLSSYYEIDDKKINISVK